MQRTWSSMCWPCADSAASPCRLAVAEAPRSLGPTRRLAPTRGANGRTAPRPRRCPGRRARGSARSGVICHLLAVIGVQSLTCMGCPWNRLVARRREDFEPAQPGDGVRSVDATHFGRGAQRAAHCRTLQQAEQQAALGAVELNATFPGGLAARHAGNDRADGGRRAAGAAGRAAVHVVECYGSARRWRWRRRPAVALATEDTGGFVESSPDAAPTRI